MSRFLCILKLLTVSVSLALVTQLSACGDEPLLADSSNVITAFDLLKSSNPTLPEDVTGMVDDRTVWLTVPADTDVTSLKPTIKYSGSSVSPADNEAQDFSEPVEYTVTAQDGSKRSYTVSVVKADDTAKDIRSLRVDGVAGTIDGQNITVTLAHGKDLAALRVLVSYTGKSVSPENNTVQDFSEPVEFTVTADDGSTKTYTVTVSVAKDSAKDIASFAIDGHDAQISGTQITLTLPSGTDRTKLSPDITITGASVDPASGDKRDFSDPVVYTVSAADGSKKEYTAIVTVAQNNAKDITRFTVQSKDATIDGNAIKLTLPYGTNLAALEATVQHTGKSVNPASGGSRDFSSPVTYTVTAEDGSTKAYTVEIKAASNPAKNISSFVIAGKTGVIDGTNIAITVPYDSDKTALTPIIGHEGTKVEPKSGEPHDFTSPVDYTVTAADGSTKTYKVTVTVTPEDAKSIDSFEIGSYVGQIVGNNITVAVSVDADVTTLIPSIDATGTVSPASGVQTDFSSPQTYTVSAADGSSLEYTVTVTKSLSSAKQITSFQIGSAVGNIDQVARKITVTWGYNVSKTALEPDVVVSANATVNPADGAATDFTGPKTYTVTAQDLTTRAYEVQVLYAPKNCRQLLADDSSKAADKYLIDPDGQGPLVPFDVYCNTDGWTLVGKVAAGDYTSDSDDAYLAKIANRLNNVSPELLLNGNAPADGEIAFFNQEKTNAIYHSFSGLRAVRIDMTQNTQSVGSVGTYYQQRIPQPSTPPDDEWDFWSAIRDARLWNRDRSVNDVYVDHFGTDFVLTDDDNNFDLTTNVVTHTGGSFGWYSETEPTLADGTTAKISHHFGLICNGLGDWAWLLTADPADGKWKNDPSKQKTLIWVR